MSVFSKKWIVLTAKGNKLAVLPQGDSQSHFEYSPACPCRPKVIMENHIMIVIHNSYDGREYHERDNEKYNLIQ